MTPEQRQALTLREQGLSRAEIAASMGKSEAAIKSLLERARKWNNADPTAYAVAKEVGGETVPHSAWIKTDNASVYYRYPQQDEASNAEWWVDAFSDIPAYEPQPVTLEQSDRLTMYALFDAHIGARCWGKETGGVDYDLKHSEADIKLAMSRLTEETPQGGEALLILGGDTLHHDSNENVTPASKHALDVDGRQRLVAEVAIRSIAWSIEHLAQHHERVTVRVHRGNHDPSSYLILAFAIMERYRDCARITIDMSETDFYMKQWGKCAIFTSHGDRGKPDTFVHKMADICPFWSESPHRVAVTGHVHKMQSQRIGGAMWYSVDAFTPADSYGSQFPGRRGFCAMTFDKKRGHIRTVYEGIDRGA